MPVLRPARGTAHGSAASRRRRARRWARRPAGSASSTCWTRINGAGRGRRPPSMGARWPVPAHPTTLARSMQTPKPGGAGTTKTPAAFPYRPPRPGQAQLCDAESVAAATRSSRPPLPRHVRAPEAEGQPAHSHHRPASAHGPWPLWPRTRSHPGQRAGWRGRRGLLHRAPGDLRAADATRPRFTSDETLYVLSGVLLVRDDGQVAAIPEGGLVHIGRGTPHTFATTPGVAARSSSCTPDTTTRTRRHNGPRARPHGMAQAHSAAGLALARDKRQVFVFCQGRRPSAGSGRIASDRQRIRAARA